MSLAHSEHVSFAIQELQLIIFFKEGIIVPFTESCSGILEDVKEYINDCKIG